MTDYDALLAAVIAAPLEDTPRLVLADYLQDNGQPDRAEFIRVQVRSEYESPCWECSVWSRRDCPVVGCKFGSDDRALSLLLQHNWTPTKGLCQYVGGGGPGDDRDGVFWRRGFIQSVRGSAEKWIAHAREIYRHPVRTVTLTTQPELDPGDWHLTPNAAIVSLRGNGRTTLAVRLEEREVVVWRLLREEWPLVEFLWDFGGFRVPSEITPDILGRLRQNAADGLTRHSVNGREVLTEHGWVVDDGRPE